MIYNTVVFIYKAFSNQLIGAAQRVPRESWNPNEPSDRMPAGSGKSAVNHTRVYTIIYAHQHLGNSDTKTQTVKRTHTKGVIQIETSQLAGDRHQRDRERWREREVKEYIKAVSVQAAV